MSFYGNSNSDGPKPAAEVVVRGWRLCGALKTFRAQMTPNPSIIGSNLGKRWKASQHFVGKTMQHIQIHSIYVENGFSPRGFFVRITMGLLRLAEGETSRRSGEDALETGSNLGSRIGRGSMSFHHRDESNLRDFSACPEFEIWAGAILRSDYLHTASLIGAGENVDVGSLTRCC